MGYDWPLRVCALVREHISEEILWIISFRNNCTRNMSSTKRIRMQVAEEPLASLKRKGTNIAMGFQIKTSFKAWFFSWRSAIQNYDSFNRKKALKSFDFVIDFIYISGFPSLQPNTFGFLSMKICGILCWRERSSKSWAIFLKLWPRYCRKWAEW